jgi:hypothetical protein
MISQPDALVIPDASVKQSVTCTIDYAVTGNTKSNSG